MRLIKTHDGMIGLQIKEKLIWCDSPAEAVPIAAAHYQRMEVTAEMIASDIHLALDIMASNGDTIAEFGVFGSFIYTTRENDQEF